MNVVLSDVHRSMLTLYAHMQQDSLLKRKVIWSLYWGCMHVTKANCLSSLERLGQSGVPFLLNYHILQGYILRAERSV
jgi:hypothetical protein